MTGIVLAGISGAGKTTLHRAVTAALAASGIETLVAIPQALTTTAHLYLADRPAQQAAAVLAWMDETVTYAECLTRRAVDGGLTVHRNAACWTPVFVLEGFLYDLPLHDIAITRPQVRPLEHRMAAVGFTVVHLVVSPDRIAAQCVQATRASRGAGWAAHLERLGASDTERAAYFAERQKGLRAWTGSSPLPVLEIDTSDLRWPDHARQILAVLGSLAVPGLARRGR